MTYHCDICSSTIEDKSGGHFFDQNRILTSPGYWLHLYTKSRGGLGLQENGIAGYMAMFCQDTSGFTVCDECQIMLKNDIVLGKEYEIKKYISSKPSGQVDTYAAGMVAGTVWQNLNGSWPSTIQLGGGGETGTLMFGVDQKKVGLLGFIKKLLGSKKHSPKKEHSESIDTICDNLMKEHMMETGGVLTSVVLTADALMKRHGITPDEAQSVIEKWLQKNKP